MKVPRSDWSLQKSRITISPDATRLTYEVVGNSFMYKQVRHMVGLLVQVGMRRITLDEVKALLKPKKRVIIPGAPAHGLTLVWIELDETPPANWTPTLPPPASQSAESSQIDVNNLNSAAPTSSEHLDAAESQMTPTSSNSHSLWRDKLWAFGLLFEGEYKRC